MTLDPVAAELTELSRLTRLLAEARLIEEVKYVRDKAEASWRFTLLAQLDVAIRNQAAGLMLRAERQVGEMLTELLPHGGDRKLATRAQALTLRKLRIEPHQSTLWRELQLAVDFAVEAGCTTLCPWPTRL